MINLKKVCLLSVILVGIILMVGSVSFISLKGMRHARLVHLFKEASGVPGYFRSSDQAEQAVREIGSVPGLESKEMLFTLAARNSDFPAMNVQVEAIRQLEVRGYPDSSKLLSNLVRTTTPIDTRKAVAEALQSVDCGWECSADLLSYLARIHRGEPNEEDTHGDSFGPGLDEVKASLASEQKWIYEVLYNVLLKRPSTTNAILADHYGLGGRDPEDFAIDFVVRSNDLESCNLLAKSMATIEVDAKNPSIELLTRLRKAVNQLQCPER